jgi:DNA-binding XRE family transcriptional regulator
MANRHRTDDVAHPSQPPNPLSALRPIPTGRAYRTNPRTHDAEIITRFGEVVCAVRKARKFSQEELAARAGLHRTHISLVEKGHREARLTTIYALAAALHITPSELLAIELPPTLSPDDPVPLPY